MRLREGTDDGKILSGLKVGQRETSADGKIENGEIGKAMEC